MMVTNRNRSMFLLFGLMIGLGIFALHSVVMIQATPRYIEDTGYSINVELTITDATSRALLNTYAVAERPVPIFTQPSSNRTDNPDPAEAG